MPLYEIGGARPTVAATAWIAPTANLIGDVRIADQATIWFGVTIRADNGPITIGARSNIQDGAVCHSDPGSPLNVGTGVTVGHRAILHGCTIHDNVLVGMGATILNDAIIPENCLIGANALVTEGKTFEAGSLILGAPAKVMRRLSAEELDGIRKGALTYLLNGERYRADFEG